MIVPPSGVRVWLATGATDMRRGMNSLALQVQESLHRDPHVGDRPVENSLARRLGDVALCQETAARQVNLAIAGGRCCSHLSRAAVCFGASA
jgi:IS66 Orf2 like protein